MHSIGIIKLQNIKQMQQAHLHSYYFFKTEIYTLTEIVKIIQFIHIKNINKKIL